MVWYVLVLGMHGMVCFSAGHAWYGSAGHAWYGILMCSYYTLHRSRIPATIRHVFQSVHILTL